MSHQDTIPIARILWRIGFVVAGYLGYVATIWFLEGRPPEPAAAVLAGTARASERDGRRVWLERGCPTCHSLVGLGGHVGPDLTNYGRSELEPALRSTVRLGRTAMPSFELSDAELDALDSYLVSVSSSARYPPSSRQDSVFGDP